MQNPTHYSFEARRLIEPYHPTCDLNACIPLTSFGSSTPIGAISVGDSITDGSTRDFLGIVRHVHHIVGEFGADSNKHITIVYVDPED